MKMWAKRNKQDGFTIVELLIVVVVIAILAAITIVAYNGIQERARQSKIKSDIATIVKAIELARQSRATSLYGITGSTATGGTCWAKPDETNLASLTSPDSCLDTYVTNMTKISNAAGMGSLANLRDPWGRPYLIDENEGEGGGCGRDTVAVYKYPFTTGFGLYAGTSSGNVPLSRFTTCT